MSINPKSEQFHPQQVKLSVKRRSLVQNSEIENDWTALTLSWDKQMADWNSLSQQKLLD